MADLEKRIDAVLGANTAARSSRGNRSKPAGRSGGSRREGVLLGVGFATLLGVGLWQVWSADKPTPTHKGA